MSCRRVGMFAWGVLLGISTSAAADEPLRPIKPWVLNYDDDQCLASRDYGTAQSPTTLAFRPMMRGDIFEVFVFRKGPSPAYAEEETGSVDFGHGPISTWLLHYRVGDKPLDVHRFKVATSEMAQARDATSITLRTKQEGEFSFSLNSMTELLKGLDACTQDLKQYWNMEEPAATNVAVRAKGSVRELFTDNDYPTEAFFRGQEGTAQFLLLVDEKGRVAGCDAIVASGAPVLDAMGCIVIQGRAKFEPARGKDGKPVRDTVVTPPVTWSNGN